jgi:hypothetical protein
MNRVRKIVHWFGLADVGLPGPAPLAVLETGVVAEAEQIRRDGRG